MKVRVKLFAVAKERAGSDALTVEVTDDATVADVRQALIAAVPALAMVVSHALWAVDAEYAPDTAPVTERSAVALIPPVSGG
jgi:molybdopterin converting factor subunit 1